MADLSPDDVWEWLSEKFGSSGGSSAGADFLSEPFSDNPGFVTPGSLQDQLDAGGADFLQPQLDEMDRQAQGVNAAGQDLTRRQTAEDVDRATSWRLAREHGMGFGNGGPVPTEWDGESALEVEPASPIQVFPGSSPGASAFDAIAFGFTVAPEAGCAQFGLQAFWALRYLQLRALEMKQLLQAAGFDLSAAMGALQSGTFDVSSVIQKLGPTTSGTIHGEVTKFTDVPCADGSFHSIGEFLSGCTLGIGGQQVNLLEALCVEDGQGNLHSLNDALAGLVYADPVDGHTRHALLKLIGIPQPGSPE